MLKAMVNFNWKSLILREFCFFNIRIWLRNDNDINVWSVLTPYAQADEKEDEEEEGEEERLYFDVLLTCNVLYVIYATSGQHFRPRWTKKGVPSVFSSAYCQIVP